MGYTTDFYGQFELDRPLAPKHAEYLNQFSETRRMKRNAGVAAKLPDPTREAAGLPIGTEGEYFVGAGGDFGQNSDESVLDYNGHPRTQPGLWCQWVPTEDGLGIEWNGTEKFYYYVEWLEYIVENFLKPWGYVLNGAVEWSGEERGDVGIIKVKDNVVTAYQGMVVYE